MEKNIEKIIQIINDYYQIEINIKDIDTNIKDLGIDSLRYMQLIVKIEDEYDIEFGDDILSGDDGIYTISKIVKSLNDIKIMNMKGI